MFLHYPCCNIESPLFRSCHRHELSRMKQKHFFRCKSTNFISNIQLKILFIYILQKHFIHTFSYVQSYLCDAVIIFIRSLRTKDNLVLGNIDMRLYVIDSYIIIYLHLVTYYFYCVKPTWLPSTLRDERLGSFSK